MDLSELNRLRTSEERNFQASIERLGDTAVLSEDFFEAYDSIGRLLRETEDPPNHLMVVSVLFLAARYQLHRAILDCLRARLSDATQATRRAIELVAFVHKIHRHPHFAQVWVDASKGGTSYDTYRRKFSRDLFPESSPLLSTLGERYDHASKHFHGSPFSVARRTAISADDGELEFAFREFEVSNDNRSEPINTFIWVIDTHFKMLQLFAEVFETQLGSAHTAWKVRENALEAKLAEHKDRWKSVVQESMRLK